jgi:hypothetical protein
VIERGGIPAGAAVFHVAPCVQLVALASVSAGEKGSSEQAGMRPNLLIRLEPVVLHERATPRRPSAPGGLLPCTTPHLATDISPSCMLGRSKSLKKSTSLSPMPIAEEGPPPPLPPGSPSAGGRSSSPATSRRLGETLHAPTGLVNGECSSTCCYGRCIVGKQG